MRVAAIDIGTNTLLMLIADVDGTSLAVVEDHHRIVRLGESLSSSGTISEAALLRAERCLQDYVRRCSETGVDRIAAVATSAVRRADNQHLVLQRLSAAAGAEVRCISGDEEAELVLLGSRENFDTVRIIDIGGGSTEIVVASGNETIFRHSLEIGAVRLHEHTLRSQPIEEEAELQARTQIESLLRPHLHRLQAAPAAPTTIAVAGTPTSLATMAQGLVHFDAQKVQGYHLSANLVRQLWKQMSQLRFDEIHDIPGVHPDRADILPSGTLILLCLMEMMSLNGVRVSVRGLRYGVALQTAQTIR